MHLLVANDVVVVHLMRADVLGQRLVNEDHE